MSEHDGGPAFPGMVGDNSRTTYEPGMTLRDWFAGQALPIAEEWEAGSPTYSGDGTPTYRGIAERAYLLADAMLVARKGTP